MHATSKERKALESLQAIESKANRVPSPGSKRINGRLVNVCPRCGQPCSSYPWTCKACGWEAAKEPHLCPCQRVHDIVEVAKGEYAYPVAAKLEDSDALTAAEKSAWTAAKASAKPLPPKDPRSTPR